LIRFRSTYRISEDDWLELEFRFSQKRVFDEKGTSGFQKAMSSAFGQAGKES
jgi:hypothetical protein